jgi:hypothetical protein
VAISCAESRIAQETGLMFKVCFAWQRTQTLWQDSQQNCQGAVG